MEFFSAQARNKSKKWEGEIYDHPQLVFFFPLTFLFKPYFTYCSFLSFTVLFFLFYYLSI